MLVPCQDTDHLVFLVTCERAEAIKRWDEWLLEESRAITCGI